MKRTTLHVALASSLSLSPLAFANDSSWSKATQRVESMNDQQGQNQSQDQSPDLVKQAQEKLSALGKEVGTPDGQMNSQTQQALQEFQRDNGLQPSGQLDQQTIAALDIDQSGSAASGSSPSGSPASESN